MVPFETYKELAQRYEMILVLMIAVIRKYGTNDHMIIQRDDSTEMFKLRADVNYDQAHVWIEPLPQHTRPQ